MIGTPTSGHVSVDVKRLDAACRRWKIAKLELFGSALRDDFGPESDIDLLATFAADAEWSLFDHIRMEDELSELFGRSVDVVNRSGIEGSRNPLRRKLILGSAVPFHDAR